MPPSDDLRDSSALRQEGPQQDDLGYNERLGKLRVLFEGSSKKLVIGFALQAICELDHLRSASRTTQEPRNDMRVIHSSEIADDPAAFEGDYVPLSDVEATVAHLLSASRTAQAPQQEVVDLVTRLIDYRGQVLNGFRHISRFEEADLIQAAIDGLRQPSETGWQPLKTAPRHARCFFWVVPKTADECNTDTSGKPITLEGRAAPHRIDGEWGWWGSLWKPLYWMPLPSPPAPRRRRYRNRNEVGL